MPFAFVKSMWNHAESALLVITCLGILSKRWPAFSFFLDQTTECQTFRTALRIVGVAIQPKQFIQKQFWVQCEKSDIRLSLWPLNPDSSQLLLAEKKKRKKKRIKYLVCPPLLISKLQPVAIFPICPIKHIHTFSATLILLSTWFPPSCFPLNRLLSFGRHAF